MIVCLPDAPTPIPARPPSQVAASPSDERSARPRPADRRFAQRTGLSKDTLRYYENAGLVEAVDRSSSGQRRYATTDLNWRP
jgi:hypothetical protein